MCQAEVATLLRRKIRKTSRSFLSVSAGFNAAFLLIFLALGLEQPWCVHATPKFEMTGPMLTLTLKDPSSASDKDSNEVLTNDPSKNRDDSSSVTGRFSSLPWLDFSSLSPGVVWEVKSLRTPLPIWLPCLKSIKAGVGYQYTNLKKLPSWVQATAKFASIAAEYILEPRYEFADERTSLFVKASRGSSFLQARFQAAPASIFKKQPPLIESVRASLFFPFSYLTLSSLRITPNYDVETQDFSCQWEATAGGLSRTKAILHMEYENPTLSVVHALDDRNTIAPTINLWDARIVYQWDSVLSNDPTGERTSLVQTRVDPAQSISVTWTDQSLEGGTWVTDIRVPLESIGQQEKGQSVQIRVRRQFSF